jgi:hypothetical protein
MRNHTTPKIHELVSTAGKNPTVTPGASAQSVTFLLNNIPTGKQGKFWYYVTALVLKLVVVVDQPAAGGTAINPDKLWKILQSVQVQCPILGMLFSHANTRGSVLGNLIQAFGFGYSAVHTRAQIAAADGDTTVTMYYRIPFAYEFLRKPHETSPWGGFLEGGTVEAKLDVSTILDGDSTGAVTKATTSFRAWLELIPSPEAVLHTPCHWREHITPGASTRHVIQDMGSPDGLQGTNQAKGVGVAVLLNLTDATGIGLSGSDGADNITGFDIPWRDQARVDVPDSSFMAMYAHMGAFKASRNGTHDGSGFPYTIAATPNGDLNDAQALVFPLIVPGRDTETSKLQTVAGAKEINFTYTATPSGSNRFVGMYFPTFDEAFMQALAARIAPGNAGELTAKTLNKQSGLIHGVGKGAYVRAKVSLG